MPVQLFFHMYDFQTKFNLIFPEIVSWDVPKFGGDLPRVYARIIYFIFFFFLFSFSYSNGMFPITVCGINLSQQTVSLLTILQ